MATAPFLRRLFYLLTRRTVRIGEHRYRRTPLLYNPFRNRRHADWLDGVYEIMLRRKPGAFVDVGINVGQTLMKVLGIDRERRYIGFDPQVGACFFAEQFIIENGLSRHSVLPLALSNRAGILELSVRSAGQDAQYSATASVVPGFRPAAFYSYTKHVPAARGDDVLPHFDLAALAVVKIDVEGAELEVVEGLLATIERHLPFIVFEVLPHYHVALRAAADAATVAFREERLDRLEQLLRARGYRIYEMSAQGVLGRTERVRPQRTADLSTTDYVAVHERDEAGFRDDLAAASRL
jgi:FkbM family methyltransferase